MRLEEYFKNFGVKADKDAFKDLKEHSACVENLSLQFYKELLRLNFFKEKDQELLEKNFNLLLLGAMLHDIGTFLKSDKPHNKRGAKIILENKIDGLDNNQNLIVANIVRFHRGSAPKKDKQKIFSELDKESRRIVKIFSSIVRIADALDWGHLSFCENIHLTYDNCREALTMSVNSNIILNVGFNEVFEKKKKLFEKIFEAKLSIKAQ